jgi:hypothetical protein
MRNSLADLASGYTNAPPLKFTVNRVGLSVAQEKSMDTSDRRYSPRYAMKIPIRFR